MFARPLAYMAAPRMLSVLLLLLGGASARTLYDELGVGPDATQKQLRAAYHKLALELHPDKKASTASAGWEGSTERFILVSEAYSTLSDPAQRRRYDATLRRPQRAGRSQGAEDFSFSFSLRDAFETLERFMASNAALEPLLAKYGAARAVLEKWPGYTKPLPELISDGLLLAGGSLAAALQTVDWGAIGSAAANSVKKQFQHADGSLDWLKVGAAAATTATAVAAVMDASDDGNRTAELLNLGGKALSWLNRMMGPKEEL